MDTPRSQFVPTRFSILILTRWLRPAVLLLLLSTFTPQLSTSFAQGTGFTYQGRLNNGTNPATGLYDFQFVLSNAPSGGSQIGSPITRLSVGVTNGLFITALDFSNAFNGQDAWLGISVRTNGTATYTALTPLQHLTPAPYAIYAGSASAAGLSGTVATANLPNGIGGTANIANGFNATVSGGLLNTASGALATVAGGTGNLASGNLSFAAGHNAQATNNGAFVWADSQAANFSSTNNDSFNVRAQGGAHFATGSAGVTVDGPLEVNGTVTAPAFVFSANSGTQLPIQIFTNANAAISGNDTLMQFGTAAIPDMVAFALNPGHGGIGDGSEFGLSLNQLAIVGTARNGFGGRLQLGTQGAASPWALSLQNIGTPSPVYPYTSNNSFINFKYGWWNGSAPVESRVAEAISTVNLTSGLATLTVYDADTPGLDNDSPGAVSHRLDVIGGVGVKGYGATILDATNSTPSTTNYAINLAQAEQDVYLFGAVNLSLTNVNALSNTASGTASALATKVVLYGGTVSNLITWSVSPAINMIWVGETGSPVAPTAMPANHVMTLDLMVSVTGHVTNCIAHAMSGLYSPVIDPLASNFFTATGLASGSQKFAINNFCLTLRQAGLVPKLKFCYPFVGPTAAINNVDLMGLHNATQHGAITNSANGIFSDGVTGYLDTGAIPSASLAAADSTFVAVWCRTVNPANGDAIGVHDSSVYEGIGVGALTVANGLNAFSQADAQPSGGNSLGFNAVNRESFGLQTIYNPATPAGGAFFDVTATSLPNTYSLYISARNDQGTADHFISANLSLAAWGDGFSSGDVANFAAAVAALQTALGR